MNDTKIADVRPIVVTDEMLYYLDGLRESGVTNMLGAGQYLVSRFSVSADDAGKILVYWIKTFGKRK